MKQVILVFIGGGFGSVLRYIISKFLNNPNATFPIGTFAVNILGSFLIGIILGLAIKNNTLNTNQTLLLATGFCGGFTTFSTFAFENQQLLKAGDFMSLALYVIASFVVAIFAVFLAMYLVK